MEISLQVLTGICIGASGIAGTLIIHTAYLASKYGRMEKRVEYNEADVKGVRFDLDSQGKKIDKIVEDSFRHFVTQGAIDHIKESWRIEVKGLITKSELLNAHNQEAHDRTDKAIEKVLETLDKHKEENDIILDNISRCLHDIQNDKRCD